MKHDLQVGDILKSSWGYDQTNIDYYEVTRLAGKTMVEFRPIKSRLIRESDDGRQEVVAPQPSHFRGGAIRRKVQVGDGYVGVDINSYSCALRCSPFDQSRATHYA